MIEVKTKHGETEAVLVGTLTEVLSDMTAILNNVQDMLAKKDKMLALIFTKSLKDAIKAGVALDETDLLESLVKGRDCAKCTDKGLCNLIKNIGGKVDVKAH